MSWYREIGQTEIIIIALFMILYGAYLIRVISVARKLGSPFAKVFVKLILRTSALGLLIVALLGPSFGSSKKEVKSIGKDIMICIDLSNSMNAFDIQPSRLEKIKFEMKKLVKSFGSDRVGLIIFSSEAYILCPLTYDQSLLNLLIESMSTNMLPSSGTDFGPPLTLAIDKILNTQESNKTEPKSKVIILISDGEDFGEKTREAVDKIEEENIKLFTLGIGTEAGGRIQTGRGYKRDRSGDVVVTKLNSSSLKQLAANTGGEYFEINASENSVPRLINRIGQIEGELKDTRTIDASSNRYYYFLGAALLFLLIDTVFNLRVLRL